MDRTRYRGKYSAHRNYYKQTSQFPAQNFNHNARPRTVRMEIQEQPEQARGVQVTYTTDPVEAEAWLRNNVIDIHTRALGFDIEWRPQFVKKKLGGKENKTAVLQLSTECDALVLHVIHLSTLPRHLVEVLADESIRKVGCGIRPDVIKLLKDTGLRCKGAIDLPDLASKSGYTKERGMGLKALAKNLLGVELNKPKSVQLSNWEYLPLNRGQIVYAALDAWVGIKLYSHLQNTTNDGKTNNGQDGKCEIDGLIDVKPSDIEIVCCSVCGKKCKGESKLQEHLAKAGHSQCTNCGKMFVFHVTRKHRNTCVGSDGHSSQSSKTVL